MREVSGKKQKNKNLSLNHLPPFVFPAVTNFNNGLEASSDSDDEDKLHIVEEDSLQEPEAGHAEGAALQASRDAARTVLPLNGSLNGGEASFSSIVLLFLCV